MAVSRKATAKRAIDKKLKTQVRWGDHDLEMFTKEKGSKEPFKRVHLKEFMENDVLPEFDMSIIWKVSRDAKERRHLDFGRHGDKMPSLGSSSEDGDEEHYSRRVEAQPVVKESRRQELVRQLSNKSTNGNSKKQKVDTTSSEGEDGEDDMEQEVEEDPLRQEDETPSRRNDRSC